ncbi:MAG: dipeptidase [Phycisphaerales bacterium]|nr:dipeptidase [Phycisphaerales bacterium]
MRRWFDGHLDLAFLAALGRNMAKEVEDCGGGLQPAAVTFSSLRAGHVKAALATIFIQRRVPVAEARRRGEEEPWCCLDTFPWCFDALKEAGDVARRQLATYARWQQEGFIEIVSPRQSLASPVVPPEPRPSGSVEHNPERKRSLTVAAPIPHEPLKVVLLMEGAVGMERVEEFDAFYEAGVRVVSLTWAEGSVWSGGDHFGGDVTWMGRELIFRMNELGIVHDVSHLSERAFWSVMELGKGMKIASHSNCRSLLPGARYPERHLSDEQIRAIVAGGGVIGVNLFSPFLVDASEERRATIADVVCHIRHMEEVAGRRDFLALGSDMDGGFSRNELPTDLDSPEKLERLAEALAADGWSKQELDRFCWGNWERVVT